MSSNATSTKLYHLTAGGDVIRTWDLRTTTRAQQQCLAELTQDPHTSVFHYLLPDLAPRSSCRRMKAGSVFIVVAADLGVDIEILPRV